MSAGKERTALGVARARFVEGLPRKGKELSAALSLVAGTPAEARPRDALRRRLQALYASAQVFRVEALAGALGENIALIDDTAERGAEFSADDLDALAHLAATLPALAGDPAPERASVAPKADFVIPRPPGVPPLDGSLPSPPKPRAGPPAAPVTLPGGPAPQVRHSLSPVVSVLVLDDAATLAALRANLPSGRYEVVCASDPEQAIALIKSVAPDIVLADCVLALAPEADLIARLRADPLTDFVPLVLLHAATAPLDPISVREAGADEALAKPIDPDTLVALLERLTHLGARPAFTVLGDLSVAELSERLSEELRRGLTEAVSRGSDVKVPIGDGSELLAATWSAIGRVRAWVSERSGGRVHFEDPVGRRGPSLIALGDEQEEADSGGGVSLAGVRAIVCDDDPAVTWFFAGLLREAGATVEEAEHGLLALTAARRERPDVVLSDIVMPHMDGLALCREMARDPILGEVPVILLSWKEDYLSRMRELRSGARGYLRKEEGAGRILSKVRQVLRPRSRLEERLRAGGEVRGRVDGLGMLPLLRTVAKARPDARVTVRDAWNLFELEMRDGEARDVNRTARDGGFARGERALLELLGVSAGRFTVEERSVPARATIPPSTTPSIEEAALLLAARVDAVSGKGLLRAATVTFDEDLLASTLAASPASVRDAVLAAKERGPRACLAGAEVSPETLEASLVDLARRGALIGVTGENGEDRIAEAFAARGGSPEAAHGVAHAYVHEGEPDGFELGSPTQDGIAADELADAEEDGMDEEDRDETGSAEADEDRAELYEGALEDLRALNSAGPHAEIADEISDEISGAAAREDELLAERIDTSPDETAEPSTSSPGALSWIVLLVGLFAVGYFGFQLAERLMAGPTGRTEPANAAPHVRPVDEAPLRRGPTPAKVVPRPAPIKLTPTGNAPNAPAPNAPAPNAPAPNAPAPNAPAPNAPVVAGLARAMAFSRRVPSLVDAGVRVLPGQGLLVVAAPPDGSPTDLFVDDQRIGRLPRSLAVTPGRHELSFHGGAGTHYRVVTVTAGETRVLTAP